MSEMNLEYVRQKVSNILESCEILQHSGELEESGETLEQAIHELIHLQFYLSKLKGERSMNIRKRVEKELAYYNPHAVTDGWRGYYKALKDVLGWMDEEGG